jgi:hypothetical protein
MSFFRRLFGRDKARSAASQAIAMIMLDNGEAFRATNAFDHFAKHWPDLPSVGDRETRDAACVANIPGGTLGLVHIPMPIPAGDLVGPVAVAWHWPDAPKSVAAHSGHVIVHAASTTLDAIELRLLLTKLAASVLTVGHGSGAYIGDAMLVRSAQDYLGDAHQASRENLPLFSWIGFNPVNENGALSAYTTGLTAFGLPELEVRGSALPAAELFGSLADIVNYELSSGQTLKDGDTFGASESDRKRVRYRASAFIPGMTVAALEFQ